MNVIADGHPCTPSVTRIPGASAQPRDETLDQGMAISIPGGVALSDTLDRGQVPHGVPLGNSVSRCELAFAAESGARLGPSRSAVVARLPLGEVRVRPASGADPI